MAPGPGPRARAWCLSAHARGMHACAVLLQMRRRGHLVIVCEYLLPRAPVRESRGTLQSAAVQSSQPKRARSRGPRRSCMRACTSRIFIYIASSSMHDGKKNPSKLALTRATAELGAANSERTVYCVVNVINCLSSDACAWQVRVLSIYGE